DVPEAGADGADADGMTCLAAALGAALPAAPRAAAKRRGVSMSRRVLRLARKELTEILRDRRTIFTLVLMPLLLYPLLTIGLGQFVAGAGSAGPQYVVAFESPADEAAVEELVRGGLTARGDDPTLPRPDLRSKTVADVTEAVRERQAHLGFRR